MGHYGIPLVISVINAGIEIMHEMILVYRCNR